MSQMELTESWKSRVAQADWLIPYYDHILERLNSGKLVKDVPGLEDPLFFLFLNKTAEERKPLYRRAFSAQVCTIWNGIAQTKQSESKITPTKRFEKIYQSAVLSVLKQYSPLYEEGMSDEELLKILSDDEKRVVFLTPVGTEVGVNTDDGWVTVTFKENAL